MPGGGPEKRVLGYEPSDSVEAGKVLRLQSPQRLKMVPPRFLLLGWHGQPARQSYLMTCPPPAS